MIRAVLGVFLLAAAAAAGEWLPEPGPDPVARAHAREVERYLAGADLQALTLPREGSVVAPATGGLAGLFIPVVYAWFPSVDGNVSTDGAEEFSLRDDFGMTDGETTAAVEFQFSLGGLGIRFNAFWVQFEGSNQLAREITFGNVTFTVNEQIESRLEINNYKVVFMIPIVKLDSFALSLLTGVSYYELDGSGETAAGQSARETGNIPIPVAGALAQMRVGRFVFEADIVGLSVDFGSVRADMIDVEVTVGMTFFKILGVRAGYRYILLDGAFDDFTIDVTLDGFFVGASLQF